jgi:hypothetical protein
MKRIQLIDLFLFPLFLFKVYPKQYKNYMKRIQLIDPTHRVSYQVPFSLTLNPKPQTLNSEP